MASSLHQNLTFLKLTTATATNATRRSYVPVRCGGPRSQRGPLVKGRILSIEAIQAIQTLKRLHRTNPPDLTRSASNTLTRLIKSDLVAALRELLRQQRCTLALCVFSILRSEYAADLSLYAEMVKALANCDMAEDVDRLICDLEEGGEIQCDDYKGLVSLIKAVIGAKRRESAVKIYALMKKCGWGSVVEPDEYVVEVLVNGLKGFDENDLAEEIWEQRAQNNKSLFNGKKFRYGGYTLHDGGGSDPEPHLCLQLGLTDYRTFVGTNLSPLWERFLVPSEDDPVLCQHTSSPLGNGAVVETIDNKILVLQRSNNVGEFPGHFVFPGGHPEPQEIGKASHRYDKELTESVNGDVSREMFDSIVREVVEEIGVPPSSLSIPAFIGISRRDLNVRPAAFFFIKCSLDSKEVQQFYSSAQDGYESTQLYAVSMVDLQNMTSRMPGCHRGGFALYKSMVDTSKNIT